MFVGSLFSLLVDSKRCEIEADLPFLVFTKSHYQIQTPYRQFEAQYLDEDFDNITRYYKIT